MKKTQHLDARLHFSSFTLHVGLMWRQSLFYNRRAGCLFMFPGTKIFWVPQTEETILQMFISVVHKKEFCLRLIPFQGKSKALTLDLPAFTISRVNSLKGLFWENTVIYLLQIGILRIPLMRVSLHPPHSTHVNLCSMRFSSSFHSKNLQWWNITIPFKTVRHNDLKPGPNREEKPD